MKSDSDLTRNQLATFLETSVFQVAKDVHCVIYEDLECFKNNITTNNNSQVILQESDGTSQGTLTVPGRVFDGHRVGNIEPLVIELLQFLQVIQDYKSLQSEYQKLIVKYKWDKREYYPFDRILLSLVQRRFVHAFSEKVNLEAVHIELFKPQKLDDGIFISPDMLTFIEEGEDFPITPFIVRNPRAGTMYWMDRPEYELAKYIATPKTFQEIQGFYMSSMPKFVKKDSSLGDLIKDYVKPMLDNNLIVLADKSWIRKNLKPNVFVKQQSVKSYPFMPRSFPSSIALVPTNRCNNFCRHCSAFIKNADRYEDEMDFALICRLLDEMHYNGLQTLRITGGEPFMRSDILDILDYAADKYFGIILFTNGNRIDKDNINRLSKINEKKEGDFLIHTSLDGGKRGHDWFRRTAGAYEKTLNAMRMLYQNGIQYYVEMCIHPMMRDEFEETAELIIQLGSRALLIHPPVGIGRGKEHSSEFHMTYSEIKEFWQKTEQLIHKYKNIDLRFTSYEIAGTSYKKQRITEREDANSADGEKLRPQKDKNSTGKQTRLNKIETRPAMGHCTAGMSQLTVDYNGNIYPCPSWPLLGTAEAIGNVYTNSILQIWQDSQKWRMSRGGWDYNDVAVCSSCPHLNSCEFGKLCRIPSMLWFGTPYGPSPSCILYHNELGVSADVVEKFYNCVKKNTSQDFQWNKVFKNLE